MSFLCDTNVVSELVRPRPNRGVVHWAAQVPTLTLSVISVEEIAFGLAWRPNSRVQGWFDTFFASECLILPVSGDIARRAGWLRGRSRGRGRSRTQADALIAATAIAHGLTLVTRNARDFEDWGLPVLDPFS